LYWAVTVFVVVELVLAMLTTLTLRVDPAAGAAMMSVVVAVVILVSCRPGVTALVVLSMST
jgi:hypothetical protein